MKKDYVIKVWCSTTICAPVLMMVVTAITALKRGIEFDAGAFGFIVFAVGYGLVISLPSSVITYFLFPVLYTKVQTVVRVKSVMLLTGLMCVVATFYLIFGSNAYNLNGNYAALTFSTVYSVCLIIFSFIYPAAKKKALPITEYL